MLSNPQKALIAQARRQAALTDEEYREALENVTGSRTSTDPRLGERHFDKVMGYLEAIYWLKVRKGELQPHCKPNAPFQHPGFWANRNNAEETSRDRYALSELSRSIAQLERGFADLGYGPEYCASIRETVSHGRTDLRALHAYRQALERTLKSKRKQAEAAHV